MDSGLDRELLDAHLRVEEFGDWIWQGPKRNGMNARGVRHHWYLDGRIRGQVRNDALIEDNTGFQHALFIVDDTADRRGSALARRREPIRRQRRAGEHMIERIRELRSSPFVSGEVVTLFATFPAIRQIFAEVLIAARHPVSERPEQPAGQGRERRVVTRSSG